MIMIMHFVIPAENWRAVMPSSGSISRHRRSGEKCIKPEDCLTTTCVTDERASGTTCVETPTGLVCQSADTECIGGRQAVQRLCPGTCDATIDDSAQFLSVILNEVDQKVNVLLRFQTRRLLSAQTSILNGRR